MNTPLQLNKEQRIKLIELITLLKPWEFKCWKEDNLVESWKTIIIVNMDTHEELTFHWYELLTTYLLLDLCTKYCIRRKDGLGNLKPVESYPKHKFRSIHGEILANRLFLNEPIHPIVTVYEHFKQFIKDGKEEVQT